MLRTGTGTWVTSVSQGGHLRHVTPWGHATVTGAVPYPLLDGDGDELDQHLQVPGSQRLEVVAGDPVNVFEWLYFTEKQGRGRDRRVTKVSGHGDGGVGYKSKAERKAADKPTA